MKSHCPNCKLMVETKEGYYYRKCVKCDGKVKDVVGNKVLGISILCFIITLLTLGMASAVDVTANVYNGQDIGIIRSDFYGVGADYLMFSTYTIDKNNDGIREAYSNYTWHRQKLLESGIKYLRFDSRLGNIYSNSSDGTLNLTGSANMNYSINTTNWAFNNNITILFILGYMPSWLADNSSGNCNTIDYCPPSNYTIWNNIIIDYINKTSNSSQWISKIELEIWNEPDGGFWLNNLSTDHQTKANEYIKLYNSSYYALKNAFPNIKIIGPALGSLSGASTTYNIDLNMTKTYLSNLTNIIDSFSIHRYSDNPYSYILNDLKNITINCNLYNANCSRIIIGEWNIINNTIKNTSSGYNLLHSSLISGGYTAMLNYVNTQSIIFRWTAAYHYGINYSGYPTKYAIVSEPDLDNELTPAYNITKLFATNHKAGNTVLNSSASRSDLKIVASKNAIVNYVTLTNTNSSAITTTLTYPLGNKYLKDVETGQAYGLVNNVTPIISLSGYQVKTMSSESGYPISISNTPSGDITIAGHTVNINSTIDSVNPLDTVSVNLSGIVTNIKDPSLILCYNFDNRSSLGENDTYVVDWCGGNNGTVIGGSNVSMTPNGKWNGGVAFNGIVNGINITTSPINLNYSNNHTISFWVKAPTYVSGNPVLIADSVSATHKSFELQLSSNNGIAYVVTNVSGTQQMFISNGSLINNTAWNLITLVIDWESSKIYYYYNGNFISVTTGTGKITPLGNGRDLTIGNRRNIEQFFNGSIDEVRIWNRSLTSNEINGNYRTSCNKFNSTQINCYSNLIINSLSNTYSLFVNDTLNNEYITGNQVITRKQNISLTTILYGSINDYFYGANTHNARRTINSTTTADSIWLTNAWLQSKMNFQRIDANIYADGSVGYANTSDMSGVNFTGNIINYSNLVTFARNNNQKILLIASYMPNWLADNSSGKCNSLHACPPSNVTKYGNIVVDLYNRIGCTHDICEVEIWNEPYLGTFFMSGLSYDNMSKALNYTKMYLEIQRLLKLNNSNIKVGGPAGFREAPIMTSTFLTNVTIDKRDFISTHPYGYTRTNGLEQLNDIKNLYLNCTNLGVSCGNNIYIDEWNVGTSALQNLTYGRDEYGNSISQSYISLLNNYPTNVSSLLYQWTELSKYNSSYPEYPSKWAMVSSISYDTEYAPSYNITYLFTRYAPSLATVKNTSSNYPEGIVQVYSTIGNTNNLIVTNTENNQQNISVSGLPSGVYIKVNGGDLFTSTGTSDIINLGVMDAYDVDVYTSAYTDYIDGAWQFVNYLDEPLRPMTSEERDSYLGSGQLEGQVCNTMVSSVIGWVALVGLVGTTILIGLAIIVLGGFGMFKKDGSMEKINGPVAILTITAIGVLLIVSIVIFSNLCLPTFG
jgi:hypothetical protein